MNIPINAKRLRATLPDVVERVRKGARFTVIYRSRPAFQIVPVDDQGHASIALVITTDGTSPGRVRCYPPPGLDQRASRSALD
jgi:antitoxin (DNA-binding transcriptional repressor) of toxin-antitoxin stability system